jgi:hypothetical protein
MDTSTKALSAERLTAEDALQAIELYYEKGWTDGLPVVPPTEQRVAEFVDRVGLDPGHVLGEIPERNRAITVELLAINAVMAGCRPEYMPILVAAVEAITDPRYKFNHMASLGSPWPLLIVNGPLGRELGFHNGMYVFGHTTRANSTVARAISLLLWNCAEAKPGGIQRGQWGNPLRGLACLAENETTAWDPLHVQLGFDRDTTTVTAISESPMFVQVHCARETPELLLDTLMEAMAANEFFRGTYTVCVSPQHVEIFARHGWSKRDVRNYLWERCGQSVAQLKRRGIWGWMADQTEGFTGDVHEMPGDADRFVHLFKPNEFDRYMQSRSSLERQSEIYIVVGGGNAGIRMAYIMPYGVSTDPVTKPVRGPR